jgi:hypothetical protein
MEDGCIGTEGHPIWYTQSCFVTLISIGFRNTIFSGFASYDYVELSHFDMTDNGATIGVWCLEGVDDRLYHYNFVHPTVSCEGLTGIIVTQPFGTMTS